MREKRCRTLVKTSFLAAAFLLTFLFVLVSGLGETVDCVHNLLNATDAQYPSYKQMRNESINTSNSYSSSLDLTNSGVSCFSEKWISSNWTLSVALNGTWKFSLYVYCDSDPPVGYLFAKIFKHNGTEINFINTTTSNVSVCASTNPPGILNNWTYDVPYGWGVNLSVGDRIGVQFCVNVTDSKNKNAYLAWENTTPSNVDFFVTMQDSDFPFFDFVYKDPPDINTFMFTDLSIVYNISDAGVGVNGSSVRIYYKANNSADDVFFYENGSSFIGYHTGGETVSNISNVWNFTLSDNEILPATYNFDEDDMRFEPNLPYDLDSDGEYLKIRLFNVSNSKNYSLFEVYAQNQTAASLSLRIYYCNSSYSEGVPAASSYCSNSYNIDASTPLNHSHPNTAHHVMPFVINLSTGMVGDVYVTQTSYFLLRGRSGDDAWDVYYIENISRQDTIQTTTDGGATWSNFTGTVNSHLHQYDGSDIFWYYPCASDVFGNENCSDEIARYDFINLTGFFPISPSVRSPQEGSYGGNVTINYSAALSPVGNPISFYNISLINLSEAFVQDIATNNSLNLSYVWDTKEAADENYYVKVEACDVMDYCSYGVSEIITVDNSFPTWSNNKSSPESGVNYSEGAWYQFNVSWSDSVVMDSVLFEHNFSGSLANYSASGNVSVEYYYNLADLSAGTYVWRCYGNDTAGNLNYTDQWSYVINKASSEVNLTLNGTSQNISIDLGDYVNITAYLVMPQTGIIQLYQNNVLINNGTGPLSNTTQYETGGTYNITVVYAENQNYSGSSETYFIFVSDLSEPTINSVNITPLDPVIGTNVFLNASASDNGEIEGIFANITLPNSTILTLSLPTEHNVSAAGRHNLTFFANDTAGNLASLEDYFIAGSQLIDVQFNVINSSFSEVSANLTIYLSGTNRSVNLYEFTGKQTDTRTDILYDLFFEAFEAKLCLRFNEINFSVDSNSTLNVDTGVLVSGFLVTYAVESNYSPTNSTLILSYSGYDYSDESSLRVYVCEDWDFSGRNCPSSWSLVSAVQVSGSDVFRIYGVNFSAYSIKEEVEVVTVLEEPGGASSFKEKFNVSIEGNCVDSTVIVSVWSDSKVMEGVEVLISKDESERLILYTDEKGEVSFSPVEEGVHRFEFRKLGYPSLTAEKEMIICEEPTMPPEEIEEELPPERAGYFVFAFIIVALVFVLFVIWYLRKKPVY